MRSIRLRSPSKINLHLRIAAPDASGFHPLRSWFVTTSLSDALTCALVDGPPGVTLRCDAASIPTDARNLVVRAAERYVEAARVAVEFALAKRVPAGAGLGGGSANAASALVALDALLGRGGVDLPALAATLGSDVPFFLGAPSAIATGRGEQLFAAPPPRAAWAVLIFPPFGIQTPAAYAMLDRLRPVAPPDTLDAFDVDAWSALDATDLSSRLVNDLESAAFAIEPSLGALRDAFERTLRRPVRMSGSGSTLFALFDAEHEAAAAADEVRRDRAAAVVVRLGAVTIGPADAVG